MTTESIEDQQYNNKTFILDLLNNPPEEHKNAVYWTHNTLCVHYGICKGCYVNSESEWCEKCYASFFE